MSACDQMVFLFLYSLGPQPMDCALHSRQVLPPQPTCSTQCSTDVPEPLPFTEGSRAHRADNLTIKAYHLKGPICYNIYLLNFRILCNNKKFLKCKLMLVSLVMSIKIRCSFIPCVAFLWEIYPEDMFAYFKVAKYKVYSLALVGTVYTKDNSRLNW